MADSRNGAGRSAATSRGTANPQTISEPSAFKFKPTADADRRDMESIPQLLRDLVDQGSQLAEQQTRLVQAEVRSGIAQLTTAVAAMAGAGVVGIAGLGVLLMGFSFLLAKLVPLWAATLIVAVATIILAYAMFETGRKKIEHSSLDMHKTRHTLERAPSAISGNRDEEDHNER